MIVKEDGSHTTSEKEANELLREYWRGVFGAEREWDKDKVEELVKDCNYVESGFEVKIGREEVERMMSMTNKASPGPDGIPFSFFQKNKERLGWIVHGVVERLLGDKCFAPPDWLLESRLVLLPKVEGKVTPAQHRPLAIMNCIYRLALRVIAKEYQLFRSDVIHPSQKAMLEERR